MAAFVSSADRAIGVRAVRALEPTLSLRGLAEAIAARIGDHPTTADAWAAIGAMRRKSGDLDGALAAFQRATAFRFPDDAAGRILDALASSDVYHAQGDYLAVTMQLAIAHELAGENSEQRSLVAMTIVRRLVLLGDARGARIALQEVKQYARYTDTERGRIAALEAYLDRLDRNWETVEQELLEALVTGLRTGDSRLVSASQMNLIEAEAVRHNFATAEWLLSDVKRKEGGTHAAVYYEALLRFEQHDYQSALHLLEPVVRQPGRNVATFEALLGRVQMALEDAEGAERNLTRAIAGFEHLRTRSRLDPLKSSVLDKRRDVFEDLFLLRINRGETSAALDVAQQMKARSIFDRIASRPATGGPGETPVVPLPSLATVLERLRGASVLTYVRARDEVWGVAIHADGAVRSHQLGDATAISTAIDRLHQNPSDASAAGALGAMLLPDELVPVGGKLVLVSDDIVADVEFPALRVHGQLVVDRYELAYAPSATILAMSRPRPHDGRAVVIGDPTRDRSGARAEAEATAATLRTEPILGLGATIETVLRARNADVLHIASHAEATSTGPALVMSDGNALGTAIVEHQVGPTLVVLTGCSSGYAAQHDELGSLAAAFVAAGAQTVVASRIDVDDDVAQRFARRFYAADGRRDPVRATAIAQRQLRDEGVPTAQWSTFMVYGGLRSSSP